MNMETYYSKKDLIKAKNDDTNYVYDLTDLEEFLKYVPTADVVLRDEVAKIFEEIDRFIELYNNEAYYSLPVAVEATAGEALTVQIIANYGYATK